MIILKWRIYINDNHEFNALINIVINALEDIKATDLEVFTVSDITPLFDYVIIATVASGRQSRAATIKIQEDVKSLGEKVLGVEGLRDGGWVLIDIGDVVLHIMQPDIRSFYKLEELWSHNQKNTAD